MTNTTTSSTRRKPGRPAAASSPDARTALLKAARELFTERDIGAVSSREIARAADVNPALINYYFAGKTGLYEAMLQDTLAPIFSRLQSLAEHKADATLKDVLTAFTHTLAANPWVSRLIMREVLSEEGRFRERFIEMIAGRGSGLLSSLLQEAQAEGRVRAELDLRLATLSFISLALFPMLGMPVASRVIGIDRKTDSLNALIEHNYELFMRGVLATPDDENTQALHTLYF